MTITGFTRLAGSGLLIATVALVGIAPAHAASSDTLVLKGTRTEVTHNESQTGASVPGDEAFTYYTLTNAKGTSPMGNALLHSETVRVLPSAGTRVQEAVVQFDLPKGTLVAEGMWTIPMDTANGQVQSLTAMPPLVMPINGGTGAYFGASGTVTRTALSADTAQFTFRFAHK